MEHERIDRDLWDALVLGAAYLRRVGERAGLHRSAFDSVLVGLRSLRPDPSGIRRATMEAGRERLGADLARFSGELFAVLAEAWADRPDRSVDPTEAAEALSACWDDLEDPERLAAAVGGHDPECIRIVRRRLLRPAGRATSLASALGGGPGRP